MEEKSLLEEMSATMDSKSCRWVSFKTAFILNGEGAHSI
jgi:hypothetical protein